MSDHRMVCGIELGGVVLSDTNKSVLERHMPGSCRSSGLVG